MGRNVDYSSSIGCSEYKASGNLEQILKTVELLLHYQSPAHDFQHILRVYRNAEMISKKEKGADLDVLVCLNEHNRILIIHHVS